MKPAHGLKPMTAVHESAFIDPSSEIGLDGQVMPWATVTKSVDAYSIVCGVPARRIWQVAKPSQNAHAIEFGSST